MFVHCMFGGPSPLADADTRINASSPTARLRLVSPTLAKLGDPRATFLPLCMAFAVEGGQQPAARDDSQVLAQHAAGNLRGLRGGAWATGPCRMRADWEKRIARGVSALGIGGAFATCSSRSQGRFRPYRVSGVLAPTIYISEGNTCSIHGRDVAPPFVGGRGRPSRKVGQPVA